YGYTRDLPPSPPRRASDLFIRSIEFCIFYCTVSVKLRKQIQSATIDDQDQHIPKHQYSEPSHSGLCSKVEHLENKAGVQFFSIANTHFLKACLVSSKLLTQIPKPLTQNAKPFIHHAKAKIG